jgi:hypothetical protein
VRAAALAAHQPPVDFLKPFYLAASPYTWGAHGFSLVVLPLGLPVPLADGVPSDGKQSAGTTGYFTFAFQANVR